MYAEETVLERCVLAFAIKCSHTHMRRACEQIQLNISIDMDAACCKQRACILCVSHRLAICLVDGNSRTHQRTFCALALLIGFQIFELHLEIQIILFARMCTLRVPMCHCLIIILEFDDELTLNEIKMLMYMDRF